MARFSPATPWTDPLQRPRSRVWLHLVLLGLTALTTTIAGTYQWREGASGFGELVSRPGALADVLAGWPYALCLLLILGSHEMGHYLACRYYGIPATLPFFLPAPPPFLLGTFGAVIRIRGAIPNRKALFDVAAAGPLAGFAVALPVLLVGILRATTLVSDPGAHGEEFGSPLVSLVIERWAHGDLELRLNSLLGAGWVGMLVTSLNLFPVGQLDGGHAAYAVSRRLHRVLSRATIFGLIGLVSYQIHSPSAMPVYLVWLAVSLFMRDRHPRLLDESSPLGRGRMILAVVLLVLFLLTFIPVPIRML